MTCDSYFYNIEISFLVWATVFLRSLEFPTHILVYSYCLLCWCYWFCLRSDVFSPMFQMLIWKISRLKFRMLSSEVSRLLHIFSKLKNDSHRSLNFYFKSISKLVRKIKLTFATAHRSSFFFCIESYIFL